MPRMNERINRIRISSLLLADLVVNYAFFVMQNYLTDVWKLSLTDAAAIINIWNGICKILPVFFHCLVDSFLGNFKLLVFTTLAYNTGMSFVAMSTPPILANLTHTCKKLEPQCIGPAQKCLLYAGLAFVAVGRSGLATSLRPFIEEQEFTRGNVHLLRKHIFLVLKTIAAVVVYVCFSLIKIKPWALVFGIPDIFIALATFLFLIYTSHYKKAPPRGSSPLCNMCRVFAAAALKASRPYPEDDPRFSYEGINEKEFSQTCCPRWLHKAAIKQKNTDDNDIKGWELCSVAEVEDTKLAVRMVPVWMTFVVCGIVQSTGSTYFVAQAGSLNGDIGKMKFSTYTSLLHIIPILLLQAARLYSKIAIKDIQTKSSNPAPSIGIAFGMISSILCCISAARVEKKRLAAVTRYGLLHKPDDDIPMSIYWLVFQFFLLGALDTLLKKNVNAYYKEYSPRSMDTYIDSFTEVASGLGYISSTLCVYGVGWISERGGRPNWFQETLNMSRLDRYYWVLAVLSTVNLIVFMFLEMRYKHLKPRDEGQQVEA